MADTSFFDKVFPNGVGSAIGLPDGTLESIIENGGDLGEYLTGYKSGNLTGESTTQGGQFFNNAIETLGGYIDTGLDALEVPRETVQEGIKFLKSDSDAVIAEKEIAQQIENQKLIELDPLGEFSGIEPNIIPDFESLNIDPDILSGLDVEVDADKETAASRESEIKRAEELKARRDSFAKNENEIADAMVSRDGKIEGELNAEDGFMAAMDDFLGSARGASPDKKERTLEQYRKEFADATGIDVSGKVDKRDALMAFGLALMQNKAGKGLNVGKMLESVGEAGDKALPALEKAKERARQGALAGGKYALQTQSSDKAVRAAANEKAMQREQYYVYQRGPDGAPFAKLDTGDLFHLSKYELNELMNDPKFDKGYSFITGKDYLDLQDTGTPTDFGDPFGKETKISLLGGDIEGVNPIYIVDGQRPDGNYKGQKKEKSFLQSDAKSIAKNFIKEQKSILKEQDEFSGLISNIQSGVSIPKQISSSIIQFGRNLGLDLNDGPTQIAQARKKLEKIQLLNATEILQESGKTLSDADRERVSKFVGTIDLGSADDALILQSLGRVYDIILQARQRDLDTAVLNLGDSFGITFEVGNDAPPTQKELDAMNKEYGTSFTMENYYTPKAGE